MHSLRVEVTAIDEEVLLVVATLGGCGATYIALDTHHRGIYLDIKQVLLDMLAHKVDDTASAIGGLKQE